MSKKATSPQLTIHHQDKMTYQGAEGSYAIIGQLPQDVSTLRVSLHITTREKKHRLKLDLYDFISVQKIAHHLAERDGFDYNNLEHDLLKLTDLLEAHRDKMLQDQEAIKLQHIIKKEYTPKAEETAIAFLQQKNLLSTLDQLITQSGIVGEEKSRKKLFLIASSYKNRNPLHALIQGSSGGGKSHLINGIASCMPQEDIVNLTRITSKSLYHYKSDDLINKLIIIQDFDGLDEEAQFAFREMQSAKFLSSSTTSKDRYGNLSSKVKRVDAHFSSMMATTRAEIYYDNMSRSVIIGLDESHLQTKKIIQYQNERLSGSINTEEEQNARRLLRNAVRALKPVEIVNPFASKIQLPLEAKMLRRLNSQFQHFVAQVTLLHQYQRKEDKQGRIITTKTDLKNALNIFFDAIIFKVDELDNSTRQFFEKLKDYVKSKETNYRFTQRELRQQLNIGKTRTAHYVRELHELEYISILEGSKNRGFKYGITHWDDLQKLRQTIKEDLTQQINQL